MIQFLFAGYLVSFAYSRLPTEIPDNLRRTAHAHFASLLKSWMCLPLTIILSPALLLPLALTLTEAVRKKVSKQICSQFPFFFFKYSLIGLKCRTQIF